MAQLGLVTMAGTVQRIPSVSTAALTVTDFRGHSRFNRPGLPASHPGRGQGRYPTVSFLDRSNFAHSGIVGKALRKRATNVDCVPASSNRSMIRCMAAGVGEGLPAALLFDCDGVLVDTERDGHRISFNQAFQQKGIPQVVWDVDLYGELLKIGGGKERMTHHFNNVGWPTELPSDEAGRKAAIADLHKLKTDLFMTLVETGSLPLRPGVARLIDEAMTAGVPVAVCSTSNERAVSAIVRVMLGPERFSKMQIFAGDVVKKKKPDPAIYLLAAETLGVSPARCAVVEDSHIGLRAAKAAGMTCVITKSGYTADEDFEGADAVFDCIGEANEQRFNLQELSNLVAINLVSAPA